MIKPSIEETIELALQGNPKLSRRDLLKLGVLAGGASGLPACAGTYGSLSPDKQPTGEELNAIISKVNPRILVDFGQHTWYPRGIDLQTYWDTPFTAPTNATVWQIGKGNPNDSQMIVMETDLGHRIAMLANPEPFVTQNDKVTPFTILGTEYTDDSRKPNHVHIDVSAPDFVRLFTKNGTDYWDYKSVAVGVVKPLQNPNSISLTGKLLTSVYDGREPAVVQLAREAERRLNAIGEKYPDTYPGWFINASRNLPNARLTPREMALYIMIMDKLIDKKEVEEAILSHLKWRTNMIIGRNGLSPEFFQPYPNPKLVDRYVKPVPNPAKFEEAKNLSGTTGQLMGGGKYYEALPLLQKWGEISPIWAEPAITRRLGTTYTRLGEHEKGLVYLLLAEGLHKYKYEHSDMNMWKLDHRILYRGIINALLNISSKIIPPNLEAGIEKQYREKLYKVSPS